MDAPEPKQILGAVRPHCVGAVVLDWNAQECGRSPKPYDPLGPIHSVRFSSPPVCKSAATFRGLGETRSACDLRLAGNILRPRDYGFLDHVSLQLLVLLVSLAMRGK